MPPRVYAKNNAKISYPRLASKPKGNLKNFPDQQAQQLIGKNSNAFVIRFTSPSGELQQVATGWCRKKWLRFDQTIRNLTSGDLGIPLVVNQLGVSGIFCQSDYLTNTFCQIFFRVYGACSANHFMINIFAHTKPHQHVGFRLINLLANILAQFAPVYKFINMRFYH